MLVFRFIVLKRQSPFIYLIYKQNSGTSSVGNDILGFDSKGRMVNDPDPHDGKLDWARICRNASKVVTFIDLAGHEKSGVFLSRSNRKLAFKKSS